MTDEKGDVIVVAGWRLQVMEVPGHTAGHIAFYMAESDGGPLLFCGDTLFSAGCGRLFEGTPTQMHGSLSRLAALPDETRVCCTHEYTLSNLRFAAAVEPANEALVAYTARCTALRAQGEITLPSSIGLEKAINPFLRCEVPAVAKAAATAKGERGTCESPVSVFAALRQWKDRF